MTKKDKAFICEQLKRIRSGAAILGEDHPESSQLLRFVALVTSLLPKQVSSIEPPVWNPKPLSQQAMIKFCPFCSTRLVRYVAFHQPLISEDDTKCESCRILFTYSRERVSIEMSDLDESIACELDEMLADEQVSGKKILPC